MRLFVAAYPSRQALDDLAQFVSTLGLANYAAGGVNVRLASRELWHFTLAFIGEVPPERVDRASAALDETSMVEARLRIGGGGKFGRGRFTVVWAGLQGDVDGLAATSRSVRARLRSARLPYDRKPFRPHLTLARPSGRAPASVVTADVAALAAYSGPEWACDEICLVSSQLGPKPVHEVIHRVTRRG